MQKRSRERRSPGVAVRTTFRLSRRSTNTWNSRLRTNMRGRTRDSKYSLSSVLSIRRSLTASLERTSRFWMIHSEMLLWRCHRFWTLITRGYCLEARSRRYRRNIGLSTLTFRLEGIKFLKIPMSSLRALVPKDGKDKWELSSPMSKE